ncbi:MAG: hypothetical protein ABIV04_13145 [Massilia sp.]
MKKSPNFVLSTPELPNSPRQRELRALNRDLLMAREKWLAHVQTRSFRNRSPKKKFARSPATTIYFLDSCTDCDWLAEMEEDFAHLEAAIKRAGYVGSSKPRGLWVPVVLRFPVELQRRIYAARSILPINLSQARAFMRQAGVSAELPGDNLFTTSRTGNKYLLHATYADGSVNSFPFRAWSVCVCEDAETKLPRVSDRLMPAERKSPDNTTPLTGRFLSSYKVLHEYDGKLLLVAYDLENDPDHYWD